VPKKPKFEKLSINMERRGELRYATAYNARDAAKIATKAAKQGWDTTVQSFSSLGTKRGIYMECHSSKVSAGRDPGFLAKAVARCKLSPAFKKRLRGR
jgi:hypothetical protein